MFAARGPGKEDYSGEHQAFCTSWFHGWFNVTTGAVQ
jgi:hypothetical protein